MLSAVLCVNVSTCALCWPQCKGVLTHVLRQQQQEILAAKPAAGAGAEEEAGTTETGGAGETELEQQLLMLRNKEKGKESKTRTPERISTQAVAISTLVIVSDNVRADITVLMSYQN